MSLSRKPNRVVTYKLRGRVFVVVELPVFR